MAETVSDVAAFSVTGSAPKFMACARFCASAWVRLPRDLALAVEGGEASLWVGWMMGAEYTSPSSSIPSSWWKFSCATLSHSADPAAPASV